MTTAINPWPWSEAFGFSQALVVPAGGKLVVCSGQVSVDEGGRPVHAGDMAAQIAQAFDNLEAVLDAGGLSMSNVVRLNYFTTDVPAFIEAGPQWIGRLGALDPKPASTLLGVAALFHPDIMVEIEATAVA